MNQLILNDRPESDHPVQADLVRPSRETQTEYEANGGRAYQVSM